MKELTLFKVQGLYRSKLDAGLSNASVRYTHAVLHRALKQAVKWSLVPRNVAEAVDPPKVRREEITPLSPEQSRAILISAREDRLEALYVVALTCGLKQGEILGLKWSDVDLVAKKLRVNRRLQRLRRDERHDLRHTCATLLLAKGVHPKLVQALLGHASISMTMDLYSHWVPAMEDQTASAMEEALREDRTEGEEDSDVA